MNIILHIFFFFQAEDGIRDYKVTGVQTCALPILLAEAGKAKQTRAFWQTVTDILSEYAGGARVELTYKGLSESGTLDAGAAGTDGETFLTDYHDAEGRHVSARFEGLPAGFPGEVLRSTIEIATH